MGWYASSTHPVHGPVALTLSVFSEDDKCSLEEFTWLSEIEVPRSGYELDRDGGGVNVAVESECDEDKLERSEDGVDGKSLEKLPRGLDEDADSDPEVNELVDNDFDDGDNGCVESGKLMVKSEEADCACGEIELELDEVAVDVVLSAFISQASTPFSPGSVIVHVQHRNDFGHRTPNSGLHINIIYNTCRSWHEKTLSANNESQGFHPRVMF